MTARRKPPVPHSAVVEEASYGGEASLQEIVALLRAPASRELASFGSSEVSLFSSLCCCPLCRLVARSVERDLRTFFAEFVNDPKAREVLRRSRGFCPLHTPLLASLGDALAIAILYSDLAERTQARWAEATTPRSRWLAQRGGKTITSLGRCPACSAAEQADVRYAGALALGLESAAVWAALETGPGLCVAHTEQVAAQASPTAAARLRDLERARLAALQTELEEIIRKNDYRFRGEAWGSERDAWLRALAKLTRPT